MEEGELSHQIRIQVIRLLILKDSRRVSWKNNKHEILERSEVVKGCGCRSWHQDRSTEGGPSLGEHEDTDYEFGVKGGKDVMKN
ncbi:unnamed protein product, partial [Dovyalis caffra]